MKYLLVAINAKYIHSNPAVYSLKEYAIANIPENVDYELKVCEYTINNQIDDILTDIYENAPDVIAFSCYIWNITYVNMLISQLKKVLPKVKIWCGGPEVSYRAKDYITEQNNIVDMVLIGEGEETLTKLITSSSEDIPGIAFINSNGDYIENPPCTDFNFDTVPFIYQNTSVKDLENRIIYYESSRGCPFSCSYCLSSIDKCIRFRSLDKVKKELKHFLDNKVPQVKFIDRTFNCNLQRATDIWRFIKENDNGITNFHFEIAADLLNEEQLELIKSFRPGLIQLEIGVQTTNDKTLKEINRRCNFEKLYSNINSVNSFNNTHQHLDLIAGLPYEDLASFKNSFNDVYSLAPNQLQLGFLKVLSGSYMKEHIEEYGIKYRSYPPYEILSSKWISFDDILALKRVEAVLEIYYNSHQFEHSIGVLEKYFDTPYELYEALGNFYASRFDATKKHSRISRYNLLLDFYKEILCMKHSDRENTYNISLLVNQCMLPDENTSKNAAYSNDVKIANKNTTYDITEIDANTKATYRNDEINIVLSFEGILSLDIYERENIKTRPDFSEDQAYYKAVISDLKRKYHLSNQDHIERYIDTDGHAQYILFDYNNRNVLNYSAKLYLLFADIV
ncbi:MAG: DUF4080 domain-containing protein [Lachnospiraceae bacterium]|nr:DUF4080 domain-containing protein [Lachnospiraceae bacterium]